MTGIGSIPVWTSASRSFPSELHHQEQPTFRIAVEVEHRDDVRVLQPRADLRLGDEHLRERRVVGEPRQHALDRDAPTKPFSSEHRAKEHLGHAAAS